MDPNSNEQPPPHAESRAGAMLELLALFACMGAGLAYFTFVVYPAFHPAHQGARESEAKIALAAIYGAERSFYSEHARFTQSLEAIGYTPEGQRRFYVVGFPRACRDREGVPEAKGQFGMLESPYAAGREEEVRQAFEGIRKPDACKDLREGFEAVAVGIIRKGGPIDVWRIDEKKALQEETLPGPAAYTLPDVSGPLRSLAGVSVGALLFLAPLGIYLNLRSRKDPGFVAMFLGGLAVFLYYFLVIFLFLMPGFSRY